MEKYHVKYSVLCLSQTTKYWTMFFLRCVISHFISLWYFLLISTGPKCVVVERLFQWLITRLFNLAIWYCLKDYTFFVIRTPLHSKIMAWIKMIFMFIQCWQQLEAQLKRGSKSWRHCGLKQTSTMMTNGLQQRLLFILTLVLFIRGKRDIFFSRLLFLIKM